jgi:hypothetical protein
VQRAVLPLLLVVGGFLRATRLAWLIARMYHVSGAYWWRRDLQGLSDTVVFHSVYQPGMSLTANSQHAATILRYQDSPRYAESPASPLH